MLIYPFMQGTWIKGESDRCSVDMSHHGGQHHGFESALWPLWMSAPGRRSIPSLTTSKRLIKLKWFKNNDDKYLWMAVLHGPMASRGLQRLNLQRFQAVLPSLCLSSALFAACHCCDSHIQHETLSFTIWHKWRKIISTDSQPNLQDFHLEDKQGLVRPPTLSQHLSTAVQQETSQYVQCSYQYQFLKKNLKYIRTSHRFLVVIST